MEVDKYTALPGEAANFAKFVSYGGFEHPIAYAAGLAIVAGGAAVGARFKHMRDSAEALRFTDPDMEASAHSAAKRHRISQLAAGVTVIAALSSGIADTAEPYTEESHNLIDNMAVVVDTSEDMYALDVVDGDEGDDGGGRTKRIDAAVNSIKRLKDLSGVDVTFVAAGAKAQEMGTIDDSSGRAEVVEEFERYTDIGKNQDGSDKAGALRIADAIEADEVLMFTGSVEDVTSTLGDESYADRVSVVATGTPGTMVDQIGIDSEREAELDHAGIEEAVGADNAYQASSVEEVQTIVDGIVREHYVETEREDFDGFETVRSLSLNALGSGFAAYVFIKGAAALSYIRQRRKGEQ